jgi:hypothetical protein
MIAMANSVARFTTSAGAFSTNSTCRVIKSNEVFLTPGQLVTWYGQSPQQALGVGTVVHTSPHLKRILVYP